VNTTDFVDVEIDSDNKLFIDPFLIEKGKKDFHKKATTDIKGFFNALLEKAVNNKETEGIQLVNNLHERNETRLGYSVKKPKGKGFAGYEGVELFNNIKESEAVQTGLVQDIFDCSIMVENVGKDKISDLVTNIIFLELIEFTQNECMKNGINMEKVTIKNKCWNSFSVTWENVTNAILPVSNTGSPIIFVPKDIVNSNLKYDYKTLYGELLLPYYEQLEILDESSGLVYLLKSGEKKVSRKMLRKKYPCKKPIVVQFVRDQNELYKNYKQNKFEYDKI
jgi:hypothetical protein